jgi:hypothetical protein
MGRPERRAYLEQVRGQADAGALRASVHENVLSAKPLVDDLRRDDTTRRASLPAGRDEQLWFYNALAEVYRLRLPDVLADETTRLVCEMGHWANHSSGFDIDPARAYGTEVRCTFASTMRRWRHEYTGRGWNPHLMPEFEAFARFIRETGVPKPWRRDAEGPR